MARKLDPGMMALTLRIQEAADAGDLSNNDTVQRLRDTLNDKHRGTGSYAYYVDHFGDGESGDVVYMCDGDCMRAPYEMEGEDGSAQRCSIDFDAAEDVVPRTIYEPEADEDEHYAAMEESFRGQGLYVKLPLYERFISKGERDEASSEDFAGKGKSFPILKPGDVMAAVRSMGRAGSKNLSPSGLKSRIIAIAKRKGWTKYLPKAWRGDGEDGEKETKKEARRAVAGGLALVESAESFDRIVRLKESSAAATVPIKLIAPGKGSSAFYPAEVLKRDGPKVFGAGTHVYVNHPTAAEEAARPEGDVSLLAGVLAKPAEWRESFIHKGVERGPGLYSSVKPFSDHANLFSEKGEFLGMSIRAEGVAESGKMREGVPVLKQLVAADSVDVVTRAGAGGVILSESAREPGTIQTQESKMQSDLTTRLLERALRGDAQEFAVKALRGLNLHEAAKEMVIENVMSRPIPRTDDDQLDTAAFKESIDTEAKRLGALLAVAGGRGRVTGMGAAPVQLSAEEAARNKQADQNEFDAAVATFRRIGMSEAAAKAAARGQSAA